MKVIVQIGARKEEYEISQSAEKALEKLTKNQSVVTITEAFVMLAEIGAKKTSKS